jgi:outer membrane PBP1 activator LpoA protein
MTVCLFVHLLRRLGLGLFLLAIATPTLAENPAQVKADAASTIGAHIGVLLPLNANPFRQPAEAVKQGLLVAAQLQPGTPPIRIYPTSDDPNNVLSVYQQALKNGAKVIVGPLTKAAVAALAASDLVSVPTLALSVPDAEPANRNLYLFGLSLDAEARQVAQFMQREMHRSVIVISAGNPLGKRLQSTFGEAWRQQGGRIVGQISYTANTDLNALHDSMAQIQNADAIFLALNAHDASLIRPYLPNKLASYATSQIFAGLSSTDNVDLGGVRFLDMPWLLQPDHPAVMVFSREEKPLSADSERLYAMGIDAYRLAQLFFQGKMPAAGPVLDGVTGQIGLDAQQFTRELTAAEFQSNVVVVLDRAQP